MKISIALLKTFLKSNSFTFPHRNAESLAIELFKVKDNILKTILDDTSRTLEVIGTFCEDLCQQ